MKVMINMLVDVTTDIDMSDDEAVAHVVQAVNEYPDIGVLFAEGYKQE